jgi:hypothetical protein
MAKRYYKTATGKPIDFDQMILKNEDTIAVGNKFVNARGDELGSGGEVVKSREEVMADYYRIHNGTIPQDRPIPDDDEVVSNPTQAVETKPDPSKDPILSEVEDANPDDGVVDADTLASTLASSAETVAEETKPTETSITDDVDTEVKEEVKAEAPAEEEKPRGGLASAVAKAKTVRSVTPKKTEQQTIKDTAGVKRI